MTALCLVLCKGVHFVIYHQVMILLCGLFYVCSLSQSGSPYVTVSHIGSEMKPMHIYIAISGNDAYESEQMLILRG